MPGAKMSHCTKGHRLTPRNLYTRKNGSRECRECSIQRARKHRKEKKP
jgi:hypothetical protein